MAQKELANQLHISQQTLSAWENGTRKASVEDMINISNFFNVSIEYLCELGAKDMIMITRSEYEALLKAGKAIENIKKREEQTISINNRGRIDKLMFISGDKNTTE